MIDFEDYYFGCSCGESYCEVIHAKHCRKCRVYTEEQMCTEVIDNRCGEVVWRSPIFRIREEAELARKLQAQKESSAFTLGSRLGDLRIV